MQVRLHVRLLQPGHESAPATSAIFSLGAWATTIEVRLHDRQLAASNAAATGPGDQHDIQARRLVTTIQVRLHDRQLAASNAATIGPASSTIFSPGTWATTIEVRLYDLSNSDELGRTLLKAL